VGKPYALTHDGSSVLADLSPDGRLVLYLGHVKGSDPGSLWIVDRSGAGRRELVRQNDSLAFFLPDGRSILYSVSASIFHRIDLQGRLLPGRLDLSGLFWLPTSDRHFGDRPTWLPDGRLATVQGRRLVAVDPASGKRTIMGKALLPPGPAWESGALISPDGREIAIPRVNPAVLLIEDVRTGHVIRQVPVTERKFWSPSGWWPDSRSLLLFNVATWQVALLDVPTGRITMLPGLRGGIYEATWSPDGSTMASAPQIPGTCMAGEEFLSFSRKEGALGPRGDGIPAVADPVWARDGRAIVYTREQRPARPCEPPHYDVWVAPLR
jgi:Tol biopolymer transport system component